MDRREFLATLTTLALAGGCRSLFGGAPVGRKEVLDEMRRQIAAGYFSCVCCANAAGEVWCEGNRRPGEDKPVPVDGQSLFEIASCSKTFTALVAALLWHEGRLDLDKPVYGEVTARDLASHRSGFTDAWMGDAGVYGGKPWPYASDAAYEAAAKSLKPAYPRGSKSVYACTNAVLLGFLVEQATGLDLDAAARKYVWGPLGMKATTWKNCPEDPRTVRMYTHGPRPLGTKGDEIARGFTRPVGNAGVFTCVDDLKLYADDLLNRRTFPKAVYDLLFTPQIEKGGRRRSFGWDMSLGANPAGWSERTITHSGYTGQFLAIDPETKRHAVVLTNLALDDSKGRSAAYRDRIRLAARVGG